MQRSSSNLQALEAVFLATFTLGYQLVSSVFGSIPPLIGLFFTYAIVKHYEKDVTYKDYSLGWYIAMFYLFIAEQIHGFELFSIAISFGIFYYFFFEKLLDIVKFRDICLMIIAAYGYIATFLVSNFLSYLKDESYLVFGPEYIAYIFVESIISLLLFKGRII